MHFVVLLFDSFNDCLYFYGMHLFVVRRIHAVLCLSEISEIHVFVVLANELNKLLLFSQELSLFRFLRILFEEITQVGYLLI